MINVAIIGTGNIAAWHIEGYLKFGDRCRIAALVDIFPDKAQEKKEKFGLLDARVFSSHEDMIKSGLRIDLADNCTPPYVHASIAIDCMNAGINVVVEKPMATCIKECDEMLEAEKRNGVILSVIAQNRFTNDVHKLKTLSDSGIAGRIRAAHVNSFWWRGHCYYDLWWRGTWEKEGGGPTLNHAVHHIDMLNWLKGKLPEEVTAVLANVMHDNSEVEDISFAIAKYADNSVAQIISSVVHHGEEQGIILQCEKAKIAAPFHVRADISRDNGHPDTNEALVNEVTAKYKALPDLAIQGHPAQIENLLDAVAGVASTAVTGEDGKRAVELITAIYKSGCLKQTVSLPIAPTDDYYTFEGLLANAVRFYKKAKSLENLGKSEITV